MVEYPPAVKKLMEALRQLPSIGPRSAERLALHILREDASLAEGLSSALRAARNSVHACERCGFYAEGPLCEICSDARRNPKLLCVVEQPTDVIAFEKSGSFNGRYFVLGGTLSPLDGIGPEELGVDALLRQVEQDGTEEVVLGLSPDTRGETTALYLAGEFKKRKVRVTRLATGVSVGGGLEYVDSVTLGHALAGRREI